MSKDFQAANIISEIAVNNTQYWVVLTLYC